MLFFTQYNLFALNAVSPLLIQFPLYAFVKLRAGLAQNCFSLYNIICFLYICTIIAFNFHLYILLFHKLIVFFTIVAFTKLCYYLYTHYYLPIFTCLYIIIKQLNGSVKKESRQNGHQYTLSATILLYRCYELIIMEG